MDKDCALRIQRMLHGTGTVLQTLQRATTYVCAMADVSSHRTIPNRTKGFQFLVVATMVKRVTSMVIQQPSLITRAIHALVSIVGSMVNVLVGVASVMMDMAEQPTRSIAYAKQGVAQTSNTEHQTWTKAPESIAMP
jgi:hypothetical protein